MSNQYEPWLELGLTGIEYWKKRYLEMSRESERFEGQLRLLAADCVDFHANAFGDDATLNSAARVFGPIARKSRALLNEGVIQLHCPNCQADKFDAPRERWDPPTAVVAETLCPDCIDALQAHEPETHYFDDGGKEVQLAK